MIWKLIARIISQPKVADWIIRRAMKTPDEHLNGYMNRYWFFNPYLRGTQRHKRRWEWLPLSIRIHHILRADSALDMHDHPWNARTIILKGFYIELKENQLEGNVRWPGDTSAILFNGYHHISYVRESGVWTFFIMFKYQGVWGFKVNGVKVPYREYFRRQGKDSYNG